MAPGGLSHFHAGSNSALLDPRCCEHTSVNSWHSIFTLPGLPVLRPAFVTLKDELLPC